MAQERSVEAHIFVGSDRSQLLAVKVLEHSIARHTDLKVNVRSMHDLDLPDPKDIRQGKRTGFSFTRFAIPQLSGYQGRALYLDADMLVFRDLREIYDLPFNGAKVLIQEELPEEVQVHDKRGAPPKRIKQCSVMMLDCQALDWDPLKIIEGLDGAYTYEELMWHLCILQPEEIGYPIPFAWNSLETFKPGETGLIHYTDMNTQPWVEPENANGWIWLNEVRLMLATGALDRAEVEQEVALGYFRPSLLVEIDEGAQDRPPTAQEIRRLKDMDRAAGYIAHKEVMEAARQRAAARKAYAAQMASVSASDAWDGVGGLFSALRRKVGF